MEKKLAKCESMGILEIVNYFGSKAYVILKKVVNHPLTKPVLCFWRRMVSRKQNNEKRL